MPRTGPRPDLTCDICGAEMVERKRKIRCPNCGYTRNAPTLNQPAEANMTDSHTCSALVLHDAKGRRLERMEQAIAEGVPASGAAAKQHRRGFPERSTVYQRFGSGLLQPERPNRLFPAVAGRPGQFLEATRSSWPPRRGPCHGNAPPFRSGNYPAPTTSLDASLPNGAIGVAPAGADADPGSYYEATTAG